MQEKKDDQQHGKTDISRCLKGKHCRRKKNYFELSQEVHLDSIGGIKYLKTKEDYKESPIFLLCPGSAGKNVSPNRRWVLSKTLRTNEKNKKKLGGKKGKKKTQYI